VKKAAVRVAEKVTAVAAESVVNAATVVVTGASVAIAATVAIGGRGGRRSATGCKCRHS
jgi:hypothetical protein